MWSGNSYLLFTLADYSDIMEILIILEESDNLCENIYLDWYNCKRIMVVFSKKMIL